MRTPFLILAAIFTLTALAGDGYRRYVNERYGYSISYPSYLVPQGASASGDGQAFKSPSGDAELRVFAAACIEGYDSNTAEYISDYEKQSALVVTYRLKRKNLAVVSGEKGDKIFYNKLLIDDGWCTQFTFEYAKSKSAIYDAATKQIALSFKR